MRTRVLLATLTLALLLPAPAVAAVAAKKEKDNGEWTEKTVVSHLDDKRINESSGLTVSVKFPDLAYTMNDEDGPIYSVKISTGQIMGEIRLRGIELGDPESIHVDPYGHLWLGDLGDNDQKRHDVSIIAFNEPGPGNFTIDSALRFPITYDGGPTNVESMMVHPVTGQVFLVSKAKKSEASLYSVDLPLEDGKQNRATNMNIEMPAMATDATFTRDGRRALVETKKTIWIYDTETWDVMTKIAAPDLEQGESLALESGDSSMLLGSEGKKSPIVRMAVPADPRPAPSTSTDGALADMGGFEPLPDAHRSGSGVDLDAILPLIVIAGLAVALGAVAWLRFGSRRSRRMRRRGASG